MTSALFITIVLMMRDLHVQTRGLSWVSMQHSQRRLLYRDLVKQVLNNFPDSVSVLWFEQYELEAALDKLMTLDR